MKVGADQAPIAAKPSTNASTTASRPDADASKNFPSLKINLSGWFIDGPFTKTKFGGTDLIMFGGSRTSVKGWFVSEV